MTPEIRLGLKLDLNITALDIREPVFAYYHEIEGSRENQEAEQHGHPLVTKTFRDSGRYWVTLSFPDLPDIFCLDEPHNDLRGVPTEEAVKRYGTHSESFARITWGHQHFITATWEGIQVLDFDKSYQRLKEILGEKFPKDPQWKAYEPTPETLEEIARALK
ncbi:MAG: hypothetical protein ACE5JU_24645 [Candidatus Binatia bacterium]